eukprot:287523-Heterocapsa_arctica.AAC.1
MLLDGLHQDCCATRDKTTQLDDLHPRQTLCLKASATTDKDLYNCRPSAPRKQTEAQNIMFSDLDHDLPLQLIGSTLTLKRPN